VEVHAHDRGIHFGLLLPVPHDLQQMHLHGRRWATKRGVGLNPQSIALFESQ
jgi:hypothetical protein